MFLMENFKSRYQSQNKRQSFPLQLFFKMFFIFKVFNFSVCHVFKKSTIWGTFSKTFCDWYLRFKGAPIMFCGTPYIYMNNHIQQPSPQQGFYRIGKSRQRGTSTRVVSQTPLTSSLVNIFWIEQTFFSSLIY